ncbi:MAG: anti-sigma factor family protein, partial [Ktedonobacterales bacterium]
MPEAYTNTTPVRIHRVTTRRRNLQALQCPLEPELLVAEFAGELPPDVTQAVREHIAVCETCGARSSALRAPYELLASLGMEQVANVPDLRDSVRAHLHANRFTKNMLRAASSVTRGGALGVTSVVGLLAIAALLFAGIFFNAHAHGVSRSSNTLGSVPAAAKSGVVFAETDKLVTVQDSAGHTWRVAEVIAVDQHTGVVARSLPASSDSLQ